MNKFWFVNTDAVYVLAGSDENKGEQATSGQILDDEDDQSFLSKIKRKLFG